MKHTITGTGAEGEKLFYEKDSLAEAGYLASKMADNGVADAQILDEDGAEVSLEKAWEAFRQSAPPGWTFR